MSTLKTLSRFFYGTTVNTNNRSIDFSEDGSTELQATLQVGAYSATEYAAEWERALREAGTRAYTVVLDRATRKLQIVSPTGAVFELWSSTGSRAGTGAWEMAGFATDADHTGALTYESDTGCGKQYDPQLVVSEYLAFEHSKVKEQGTVNVTPAGVVQAIQFGDGSRSEMNIRGITNLALQNTSFVQNLNGVDDALDFIAYCQSKGRVEFMPNKALPAIFTKCFLESTASDRNGLDFRLQNMAVGIYQTGKLTFRKVLV